MLIPHSILGMNLPALAFYGLHTAFATRTDVAPDLDPLVRGNIRLVRFFASYRTLPAESCAERVFATLQHLAERDMQAILTLDDNSGLSECYIRATQAWRTGAERHLSQDYWHGKHYEHTYIPHVRRFLGTLTALIEAQPPAVAKKMRKTLYMVELGNAYSLQHSRIRPQPIDESLLSSFLRFAKDASNLVRGYFPKVNLSTGLVNTARLVDPSANDDDRRTIARALYRLKNIDCVSVHWQYGVDAQQEEVETRYTEIDLCNPSPCYVGDLGSASAVNDVVCLKRDMLRWANKGAVAIVASWHALRADVALDQHEDALAELASVAPHIIPDAELPEPLTLAGARASLLPAATSTPRVSLPMQGRCVI